MYNLDKVDSNESTYSVLLFVAWLICRLSENSKLGKLLTIMFQAEHGTKKQDKIIVVGFVLLAFCRFIVLLSSFGLIVLSLIYLYGRG